MNIDWVNPETLKPNPRNPNSHSKEQIEIFVERGNEDRAVFGIGIRESEAKKAGKQ